MIETVVSVGYPVDETLHIKKNRLIPEAGLSGGEKRISIVTGTHGDELEGQYVCYELQRRVREHPDCLKGKALILRAGGSRKPVAALALFDLACFACM